MSHAVNAHNAVSVVTQMYGAHLQDYEQRTQQLAQQLAHEQKGRAELTKKNELLMAEIVNIRKLYREAVGELPKSLVPSSGDAQENEERMAGMERGGNKGS